MRLAVGSTCVSPALPSRVLNGMDSGATMRRIVAVGRPLQAPPTSVITAPIHNRLTEADGCQIREQQARREPRSCSGWCPTRIAGGRSPRADTRGLGPPQALDAHLRPCAQSDLHVRWSTLISDPHHPGGDSSSPVVAGPARTTPSSRDVRLGTPRQRSVLGCRSTLPLPASGPAPIGGTLSALDYVSVSDRRSVRQ